MTFLAGQVVTADGLNVATTRVVARHKRTSNSTASASETGVLRIDDIDLEVGHCYKISTGPLNIDSSVANDIVGARLRYTTNGSTPTTASTQGVSCSYRQVDASNPETTEMMFTYVPAAAGEQLSVLLSSYRVTGTGTVSILGNSAGNPIEVLIEDTGEDTGSVGVDL